MNAFDTIIEILKAPSSQRTESQINYLQSSTYQIGLFKTYKEEDGDDQLHKLCCLYMKHEFFYKGQTVFKIDDVGTKFYIILNGKVGVHIRMPKIKTVDDNNNQTQQTEAQNGEDLKMVKELISGDSFGELALMKNQRRLASIICNENCHFGVIDKKIFNIALKEKEIEKLNFQMKFLAESPLFSQLPKSAIRILHMNSFYVKYKKNQIVYSEDQYANATYLIKSGEFTIFKKVDSVVQSHKKKNEYQTFGDQQKTIDIKLGVLEVGVLFGEYEILKNMRRKYSITCTSLDGGELMIINKIDLEGRVLCEDNYRTMFEKYSDGRIKELKQREEGIIQSLDKYQQYRFATATQKNQEIDMCEQIKNKSFNLSPEIVDDIIASTGITLDPEESYGINSLRQREQPSSTLQNRLMQISLPKASIVITPVEDKQRDSMSISEVQSHHNLSPVKLSPDINHHKRMTFNDFEQSSSQFEKIRKNSYLYNSGASNKEEVSPLMISSTRSIRKQGKEEFLNEFILHNHQHQQNEKTINKKRESSNLENVFIRAPDNNIQRKSVQIMRLELDSYSSLKETIRKKAAVTLSKKNKQPYTQFLSTCSNYDISYSSREQQLLSGHDTESQTQGSSQQKTKSTLDNPFSMKSSLPMIDGQKTQLSLDNNIFSLKNSLTIIDSDFKSSKNKFSKLSPTLLHPPQNESLQNIPEIQEIQDIHEEEKFSNSKEQQFRNAESAFENQTSPQSVSSLLNKAFPFSNKQEEFEQKLDKEKNQEITQQDQAINPRMTTSDCFQESQHDDFNEFNSYPKSIQQSQAQVNTKLVISQKLNENSFLQNPFQSFNNLEKEEDENMNQLKDVPSNVPQKNVKDKNVSSLKQSLSVSLKNASLYFQKYDRRSQKRVLRLHHTISETQTARPSTVLTSNEKWNVGSRTQTCTSPTDQIKRPFLQDNLIPLFTTTTSFQYSSAKRNKKSVIMNDTSKKYNLDSSQKKNFAEETSFNKNQIMETFSLFEPHFVPFPAPPILQDKASSPRTLFSRKQHFSEHGQLESSKQFFPSSISKEVKQSTINKFQQQLNPYFLVQEQSNSTSQPIQTKQFNNSKQSNQIGNSSSKQTTLNNQKKFVPQTKSLSFSCFFNSNTNLSQKNANTKTLTSPRKLELSNVSDTFPRFIPIPTPFTARASQCKQEQQNKKNFSITSKIDISTNQKAGIRSAQQQFRPHLNSKTKQIKSSGSFSRTPFFLEYQKALSNYGVSNVPSQLKSFSLTDAIKNQQFVLPSPHFSSKLSMQNFSSNENNI